MGMVLKQEGEAESWPAPEHLEQEGLRMSRSFRHRPCHWAGGVSLVMLLGACQPSAPSENATPAATPVAVERYVPLDAEAALVRATTALTGLRPTAEELETVRTTPERLADIVAGYVERPEFGETIKDMYAEILLMRSLELVLPNIGLIEDALRSEIRDALSEEPLDLIREVVITDRPFTDIVRANWTVLNGLSARMWSGHDYNSAEGGLQRVNYTDGRPAAGVLSTAPFLVRHESNGANYHRGRADVLSDVFLCEPFGDRDIPISGDVDLSDDEAVANALVENPECVACHQVVDPLAQHFWPFRARVTGPQLVNGHDRDNCEPPAICYPVPILRDPVTLDGELVDPWDILGLRGPNYWGAATASLDDVGQKIAADPRFARCAVQQFAAYLAQTDRGALDPDFVGRHQVAFADSGFDAKALAKAIVLDEWFLAQALGDGASEGTPEVPGPQVLRPEQYERFIESLTGFRLEYYVAQSNIGAVRALRSDELGFRAMAGGIDGSNVTEPVHTVTPVKLLVLSAYAEEAAGFVVDTDFAVDAAQRHLLRWIEASDEDEAAIRTQLVELHAQAYGRIVASEDEAITELYELWAAVAADSTPTDAWKSVLIGMFQSPDIIFY